MQVFEQDPKVTDGILGVWQIIEMCNAILAVALLVIYAVWMDWILHTIYVLALIFISIDAYLSLVLWWQVSYFRRYFRQYPEIRENILVTSTDIILLHSKSRLDRSRLSRRIPVLLFPEFLPPPLYEEIRIPIQSIVKVEAVDLKDEVNELLKMYRCRAAIIRRLFFQKAFEGKVSIGVGFIEDFPQTPDGMGNNSDENRIEGSGSSPTIFMFQLKDPEGFRQAVEDLRQQPTNAEVV